MEETGKKSAEESESLYVGSSALSSGAPYLIATSLSSSIIVYRIAGNVCGINILRFTEK